MANKFKVNQLILTNNTVTTSGNDIYINGIIPYSGNVLNLGWNTLPWNNPIIWNATLNSVEDRIRIVLTGNSTLNISGLYNGWAGAAEIIQSGNSTSGYSLGLPSNTKVINSGSGILNLTRISGARDIAGFEYNGFTLFCALGNSFN